MLTVHDVPLCIDDTVNIVHTRMIGPSASTLSRCLHVAVKTKSIIDNSESTVLGFEEKLMV